MTKKPSYRFVVYTEPWEQRKLGDVSTITMGQSPNSENYTDNPNDSILVQGNADMKNGRVFPRVWTTQITKQARQGDLILSVRAPVGDIGKTDYDVVLGRGVASIDGNEFLYQALSQMKQNGYWSKLSTGSTFESINSNDIKSAIISLPSLPEQTAIGSFFQDIDQLISLQQRKLEVLKEQKKTYLKLLFPVKGQTKPALRFAGFEDEWKEVKLGEILVERNEQISESEEYQLMSFVQGKGVVPKSDRYDRSFLVKDDKKNYKKTEYGDFIYSSNNLDTGSIGFNKTGKALISPVYSIFYSKTKKESQFIAILSQRKEFINEMIKYRQGVVYGQFRIHESDFLNIKILAPESNEQEFLITFFQDLDKAIAKQEEKVNQLKESKQTLLRKMFI